MSEMNNTQVDNAKDLDDFMPVYNLTEYSDNYSKTSEGLWRYYRDESHNGGILNSESFKSKIRITRKIPADGNKKDLEIAVPIKYLSNFWRTFETPLINCAINVILTFQLRFI